MTDEIKEETPTSEDTTSSENVEAEKPEESKDMQTVLKQKEHWRTKAIDPNSGKEYKVLYEEATKPKEIIPQPKSPETKTDPMEAVKISKILNKYSDDESEFLISRAGSVSYEAIKKAEEDNWTQVAIAGMREKVAKEQAIPDPGGVSRTGFRLKSNEEVAAMTPIQRRQYSEDYMKNNSASQGV
jgi:hypothetical protein